jgi:hypothetical protein
MYPYYHMRITSEAVSSRFGRAAFRQVLYGNIGQDGLAGQIGHPEYHFDDSQFARAYKYLGDLKGNIAKHIWWDHDIPAARHAYGQFTHALQDFYAHSNYISLYVQEHQIQLEQWDGQIDCLDQTILQSPDLISGHFYSPWEFVTFLPGIGKLFIPLFPRTSHAHMNIDSPAASRWFPLAYRAAVERTRVESDQLFAALSAVNAGRMRDFFGKAE